MKCEVFHHLARCHRLGGDLDQAIESCRSGLKLCAQAANSKDPAAPQWRTYFLFRLAECQLDSAAGATAALETLDELESEEERLKMGERALLALSRAVIHLHTGSIDSADKQLTACATELERALGEEGAGGGDIASDVVQRMRGHYFLMYAITAQAVGRSAQLQQGKEYPVFVQLQEALSGASAEESTWLPAPAAAALGHMLHSAVLRAAGRPAEAAMQMGQAEELVESSLAATRLSWNASEDDLASGLLEPAAVYLHLRCMAGEHRMLAALLSADFSSAARHAAQLGAALQRFPRALKARGPSIAMLLGTAPFKHAFTRWRDLLLWCMSNLVP